MALEGTIRDFGLPDIFQLIGLQRKTGTLTLTRDRDQESVTIVFESGMVVMADSSARRLEDRLGNVLVKQGKLTRERLDEALSVQRQTLQRLGHVLAVSNALTKTELRDALQVQISQIVFRVFRWRDGRYQFTPSESVDYDRENFSPMSTDFILMEGIRMVDEWPIIEKKVTSLDMVFRPVVDPSLIEVSAGSEGEAGAAERRTAASASGRIRLSAEEERVFRKVDGVRTVQAIIDATGATEFDVCRTLFDFLNRNLIAPAGRGSADDEEEPAPLEVRSATPGYFMLGVVSVLALVGFALRWNSPFTVTGLAPTISASYGLLHEDSTRSRLERLESAVEAWRATRGMPPKTLEELAAAGLVDRSYLADPWRRRFHYQVAGRGYLLAAVDEGGRPRSDADLVRRGGE